ncbi:MAG: hypothetical protein K9K32_07130, partial [Halanaerobiales bacterium]|nr:hypothetical protein [Halanaerobiales bacterium]
QVGSNVAYNEVDDELKIQSQQLAEKLDNINNQLIQQNIQDYDLGYIYGVEQNWNTDMMTRLEGASGLSQSDFDNIYPWAGMRRVNLADDGTVNAYYGDPTYAEDGSNGQVMVEIPKFYYRVEKLSVSGEEVTRWYVSNQQKTGFDVHPAFVRDGEEKDFIYIGAYEATIFDNSASAYAGDGITYDYSNDIMASVADLQPISGNNDHLDILEARQLATNRGTGWTQQDYLTRSAIQLLYYIEYANMNIQSTISEGITNLDSGSGNHSQNTGHTSSLGNDSGEVVISSLENGATGATETYACSYRGIENPFGNIWEFMDGLFIKDDGYYFESDINNWNNDGNGYTHIHTQPINTSGYIDNISYYNGFDFGFIGESTSGGSSSYLCDYQWSHDSGEVNIARVGGYWNHGSQAGVSSLHLHRVASASIRSISARLLYIN